jgi:hypothetical protein
LRANVRIKNALYDLLNLRHRANDDLKYSPDDDGEDAICCIMKGLIKNEVGRQRQKFGLMHNAP